MEKRYYYKKLDETAWFNLKSPDYKDNPEYMEITEDEWNAHIEEISPKPEAVIAE